MINQSIGLAAFGILLAGIGALGWSGRQGYGRAMRKAASQEAKRRRRSKRDPR